MKTQQSIKINRYLINFKNPGPNLVTEVQKQYQCGVDLLPVNFGPSGDLSKRTFNKSKLSQNCD